MARDFHYRQSVPEVYGDGARVPRRAQGRLVMLGLGLDRKLLAGPFNKGIGPPPGRCGSNG